MQTHLTFWLAGRLALWSFSFLLSQLIVAQQAGFVVSTETDDHLFYESDALGNFIPDFSYAGYRSGNVPLPELATKITVSPIPGDNTAHIQAALDSVGKLPFDEQGFRGAVQLSPGTYRVSGTLFIQDCGVVLRGAGQGRDSLANTIILATGNTPRRRNVITVGGKAEVNWNNKIKGSECSILSELVPGGSRTLRVASPQMYAPGDQVVIRHYSLDNWLATINYGDTDTDAPWNPGQINLVYIRQVEAVNEQTGQIRLNIPIYDRMEQKLTDFRIYRFDDKGIHRNCGVESLHVLMETNDPEDENHAGSAILLKGVEDAWVKNVTATHYSSSCVKLAVANRVTVKGCIALAPHSQIKEGRRYAFATNFQVSNALFTECRAEDSRQPFMCNSTSKGSGIVFHDCRAVGSREPGLSLRRWSQAVLFDNIVFEQPKTDILIELGNRGSEGSSHGWAAVNSVAWNITSPAGGKVRVHRPPGRQNYVVGGNVEVTTEGPFRFPAGYAEQLNSTPSIKSLYETQLTKRIHYGALPDPTGRVFAYNYGDRVVVNWDDASMTETGYGIFYSTDGGASFTLAGEVSTDFTSFDHLVTHRNPAGVRYRVVTQQDGCLSPPSRQATLQEMPHTQKGMALHFENSATESLTLGSSAAKASRFDFDDSCESLKISVADPIRQPMGGYKPYIFRVLTESGEHVKDISDGVMVSMRVRSRERVRVSVLLRSGRGATEERSFPLHLDVPGQSSMKEWSRYTLTWDSTTIFGFDAHDLMDCWVYLDYGTDNFRGNHFEIDYLTVGAVNPDPRRDSPCSAADQSSHEGRINAPHILMPDVADERLHFISAAPFSAKEWSIHSLDGRLMLAGDKHKLFTQKHEIERGIYHMKSTLKSGTTIMRKITII